jgi:hypothetical protein
MYGERPRVDANTTEYQIAEGILARSVGENVVLFHPWTERLLTLNAPAGRIWTLLAEETSTAHLIARLADEYAGSPALIAQQTLEFLAELEREKILRWRE